MSRTPIGGGQYYTSSDFATLRAQSAKSGAEGAIDRILFREHDDEHSWLNFFPKLRRNTALLVGRVLTFKPSCRAAAMAAIEYKLGDDA